MITVLFDSTVVLLQPIVEVFTRLLLSITAHCLTNRSQIGNMPICCYLLENMANHSNRLLEKSLESQSVSTTAKTASGEEFRPLRCCKWVLSELKHRRLKPVVVIKG